jgi:cell division septal protein FtsQ
MMKKADMTDLSDWLKSVQKPAARRTEKRTKKIKPQTAARRYNYEARSQPPVMVRGNLDGMPLRARKGVKTKARRRYDLTLNVPGAEMRLPALPMISVGPRLISGMLVVALGFLAYFLWTTPTFQVQAAKISGLQRLSGNDVSTVLDVAGQQIFTLSAQELEKNLRQAFPEFSSVSVKIGFPNDVQVTVVERQPILTWRQADRTILVDANGVAFPQRDLAEVPTLTVEASGPPSVPAEAVQETDPQSETQANAQFLPVEMVSAILSLSAFVPQNTPLIFDNEHGLGWKDNQGWDVYFGDIRDIDMKLRVYQAMLKTFKKEKINPVLISVEYVHTPYYRLER